MKKDFLLGALFFVSLLFLSQVLLADELLDAKLSDFNQLVGFFQRNYGMDDWKDSQFSVSARKLKEKYLPLVTDEKVADLESFLNVLSKLTAEFKDAHVAFRRPSDEQAFLGFFVQPIDDKAIIIKIKKEILTKEIFPFDIGDELVSLDGVLIPDLLSEINQYSALGTPESTNNINHLLLTYKSGKFMPVPEGSTVVVGIVPKGYNEVVYIDLPWIKSGSKLPNIFPVDGSLSIPGNNIIPKVPDSPPPLLEITKKWDPYNFKASIAFNAMNDISEDVLKNKVYADVSLVQSEPFKAFTFDVPVKGPLGYLELKTFGPANQQEMLKKYKEVLKKLSASTRGLIIDMRDNGGGSLFYGYSIASLLTDKPLEAPTFSVRISRNWILGYREWLSELTNLSLKATLESVLKNIEKAADEGKKFSPYQPLDGKKYILPDNEVNYTKPIVLLINERCFSMADIFAGIMKDNKRALLFGAKTAGAGGNVNEYGPLAFSEARVYITESIVQRSNGEIIENLGVKPDYERTVHREDVEDGLSTYQLEAILMLAMMVQ